MIILSKVRIKIKKREVQNCRKNFRMSFRRSGFIWRPKLRKIGVIGTLT